MAKDRLAKLRARRDPGLLDAVRLENFSTRQYEMIKEAERYERAKYGSATKYVIGTMEPVGADYTANTLKDAERVREQLAKGLRAHELFPEFEYQGSTVNNTHIKYFSDIDLLVLHGAFVDLEPPQVPTVPYQGDTVGDLTKLRTKGVEVIGEAFPAVDIDSSGPKSVALTGGSLSRKVDVVAANWWNTNKYAETGHKVYRGVMVLDAENGQRVKNMPFLHNALLDLKDDATGGGLRKAIRFLKSVRYDADPPLRISSYDICSIAYNMPESLLLGGDHLELPLAINCLRFLETMDRNAYERDKLLVPNGMRAVFSAGGAKPEDLKALIVELREVVTDVSNELKQGVQFLAEARIEY